MDVFIYLIKINIAIALLYGIYSIFFKKDTFFQWKRFLLLSFFFISLVYPLVDFIPELIPHKTMVQLAGNIPVFQLEETWIRTGPEIDASFFGKNQLTNLFSGIYMLGVIGVFSWIIIQLASVFQLIRKAKSDKINGYKILNKNGLKTPFSFFRWIVLDTELYTDKERDEILQHEYTHVNQHHSLDMILSELMCVFCWFNPFVWLIKQEIRMNLEYLADRSVIESGINSEHYQLHLLRLTYHKAAATITNNFYVSPLKKRISMMNKKKTSILGLTKYALCLPVIGSLFLFNSMTSVGKTNNAFEANVSGINDPVIQSDTLPVDISKEVIYDEVEKPPQFPGGKKALAQFLNEEGQYPAESIDKGIQGRVVVRFVVGKDGSVSNIEIVRNLDPFTDKESMRVVSKMPKWIPGEINGKPAAVYFVLPISFSLGNGGAEKVPPPVIIEDK